MIVAPKDSPKKSTKSVNPVIQHATPVKAPSIPNASSASPAYT